MKYDVFISHSAKDESEVKKICTYLEENSLSCFVSYRDIPSGVSYPGEITRAIRESELLLLVLTNNSNSSTQVDKEITLANDLKKKLLCIRLEDIAYSDDKAYLMSGVNWLDAFLNPQDCFFDLLKDVCVQLGRPIPERRNTEDNDEQKRLRLGDFLIEASQGNSEAMFRLGQTYRLGWNDIVQDDAMAAQWYLKAAKKNHSTAMNCLGWMYQYGVGVQKSIADSKKWYTDAARMGDILAACNLGDIYYYGEENVPIDYSEAVKWYTLAANYGHGPAQIMLGKCYYNGYGVSEDFSKAAQLFQAAADQDNDEAQNLLAICYRDGIGVEANPEKRLFWLEKSAENRNENAIIELSELYGDENYPEHDDVKSFEYDCKLLELGMPSGYWRLCIDYQNGIGCEVDNEKAKDYLFKAASKDIASAQNVLGVFYLEGSEEFGIEKNEDLALHWYIKAANNGNSDAQASLGIAYGDGGWLPTDLTRSFEYLLQSAKNGSPQGQYALSEAYFHGQGVERNECEAFNWMKEVAENNGAGFAMAQLGVYFFYGIGCEQNFEKAVEWLSKSIEEEWFADADTLAVCYEFGYGVEQDIDKAISLYQKVIQLEEEHPGSAITIMAHDALVRLGVEKE